MGHFWSIQSPIYTSIYFISVEINEMKLEKISVMHWYQFQKEN